MYNIYYTSIVTDSLIRTEVNRIKETKGFLVLSEIEVHPCAIKRGMKPLPSYIAAAGGGSPRRRDAAAPFFTVCTIAASALELR